MSLIYTCDSLLPDSVRWGSPKFLRFARVFTAAKIDWGDAQELVTFMHAVPVTSARWVFHWTAFATKQARMLWEYEDLKASVKGHAEAEAGRLDVDDGLAILRAMRAGGWNAGWVPPAVRMSVLALMDQGNSMAKVGRMVGLNRDRIFNLVHGPRSSGADADPQIFGVFG